MNTEKRTASWWLESTAAESKSMKTIPYPPPFLHSVTHPVADYFDFLRQEPRKLDGDRSLGYIVIDEKGMIKSVNTAAMGMLNAGKEELIRAEFLPFVCEEDRLKYHLSIERLRDLSHQSFDVRLENGDDFIWVRISIIFDEESFFYDRQISLILQNINSQKLIEAENKKLRHQIRQTQKMEAIGELSGGIAHDLNNILHPIIGSLEMLIEDASHDKKLQKALRKVLTGANRAGSLVKQILSFSHHDECDISSVRIQPIVREVLKLSRSTLPPSISIMQSIDNECGPVVADPTHIYQIAMNLITNAFHAMGENGGTLGVGLKEVEVSDPRKSGRDKLAPGMYSCLSISDTGEGIEKGIINKIFEPYFTTKENGTGTGLGLSVIYSIVKKYGGDIIVSSTPGEGSCFQVYLPRGYASPDSDIVIPELQENLCGCESILFVDDDPFIVDIQKETLERYGYVVTPCYNGQDALNEFRAGPGMFDIVVCDMAMPVLNGLEVAGQIKKLQPDMPVIICTGYSEQINKDNYEDLGIDGFLMKPVNKEDSLNLIRRLLDTR